MKSFLTIAEPAVFFRGFCLPGRILPAMRDDQNIALRKRRLRQEMLFRLKSQSEGDKMAKSFKIKDLAAKNPFFATAETIMCYASFSGEVDTWGLIEESIRSGKKVALPRTNPQAGEIIPHRITDTASLIRGNFGILEPENNEETVISLPEIDLVFVPGIAFDKRGNRLGRGGGFYDRFLSGLDARTLKVGLAFDFQIVENIPIESEKDVLLDLVISA